MKAMYTVFVLLGLCVGLIAGYMITSHFNAPAEQSSAWYPIRFVGGHGWYFTTAQLRECAECDAPMWSDAWCENCYRIWAVHDER